MEQKNVLGAGALHTTGAVYIFGIFYIALPLKHPETSLFEGRNPLFRQLDQPERE